MLKYGSLFTLTQKQLDKIANYMNDEIRENLHFRLAPCDPIVFLHLWKIQ